MVAHFLEQLDAQGAPDDLLAPVMIVMAISAALAGILLCRLGLARAGGAIRFIPYRLVGGFPGATVDGEWSPTRGSASRRLGVCLVPRSWPRLPRRVPLLWLFISAYAGAVDSPYVLPGILLAAIAMTYLAFALAGVDPRRSTSARADWSRRRSACSHVRDGDHHAVEHNRDRVCHQHRLTKARRPTACTSFSKIGIMVKFDDGRSVRMRSIPPSAKWG
jgi:hypothetical protein